MSNETSEHFTAWITTDPSALEGEHADVVVLRDEIDDEGGEDRPAKWHSVGDPVFRAVLPARYDDPDVAALANEALLNAGWRTAGHGWEAVPTGAEQTVEKL